MQNEFDKYINSITEDLNNIDLAATVAFTDKAAQTIFASIWADWIEENAQKSAKYRNILSGKDVLEIAPDYDEFLSKHDKYRFENKIYEMIARFEEANGKRDVLDLYQHALKMDGQTEENPSSGSTQEMFGYYVLMQMLGHGVSWNDDHENPGFKYPHTELSYLEFPESFHEVEPDPFESDDEGEDFEEWEYEGEEWKDEYKPDDNAGEEWKDK